MNSIYLFFVLEIALLLLFLLFPYFPSSKLYSIPNHPIINPPAPFRFLISLAVCLLAGWLAYTSIATQSSSKKRKAETRYLKVSCLFFFLAPFLFLGGGVLRFVRQRPRSPHLLTIDSGPQQEEDQTRGRRGQKHDRCESEEGSKKRKERKCVPWEIPIYRQIRSSTSHRGCRTTSSRPR